jgi:hypothetical protein
MMSNGQQVRVQHLEKKFDQLGDLFVQLRVQISIEIGSLISLFAAIGGVNNHHR